MEPLAVIWNETKCKCFKIKMLSSLINRHADFERFNWTYYELKFVNGREVNATPHA